MDIDRDLKEIEIKMKTIVKHKSSRGGDTVESAASEIRRADFPTPLNRIKEYTADDWSGKGFHQRNPPHHDPRL